MTETLDLTKELISRASVTPEDAGCQRLIAERLSALGFSIESMPFGEVENLWARRGDEGPLLCFAGHTDVVPAGPADDWRTDPFVPEIHDGILYGRGAADMKASLAAMVVAAEQFVTRHPQHTGSIAFLITNDEEGRARDGTKKVMETLTARGEKIDWCVIGEPSCNAEFGDCVRIGRRGSLSGMLTVHGQQGHVAYPQLADNPIQKFAPVLAELFANELDTGNEYFPPTSFQVVRLGKRCRRDERHSRFVIRPLQFPLFDRLDALEAAAPYRTLPRQPGAQLHAGMASVRRAVPDPGGQTCRSHAGCHQRRHRHRTGILHGGGTSDGRFIAPCGAHVVEFGPINATIHKVNEEIALADVDRLRQVYQLILEKMLPTA